MRAPVKKKVATQSARKPSRPHLLKPKTDKRLSDADQFLLPTYKRQPFDHYGRFTDTWMYLNGKWQCIASHTNLIKK